MRNLIFLLVINCGAANEIPGPPRAPKELLPGRYQVALTEQYYDCYSNTTTHHKDEADLKEYWTLNNEAGVWTAVSEDYWWIELTGVGTEKLLLKASGVQSAMLPVDRVCNYSYEWAVELGPTLNGFKGSSKYKTDFSNCDTIYDACDQSAILKGILYDQQY